MIEYTWDEERIFSELRLPTGRILKIQANSIRRERTGVHALIEISIKGSTKNVILAWDRFNIERDADRTRLSNSAYKQFLDEDKVYTSGELKQALDTFSGGLWEKSLEAFQPSPLVGEESKTQFLLDPYIIEGGGTILFGPPGRGKSFTAQLMMVCVDAGVDTFWKVKCADVLFINLERSRQSAANRLAPLNRILGYGSERPLMTLNARGKSLMEVADGIRKAIKKYNIKLVVLDSISRAGFGDLTENKPVNAIMDCLNDLCPTWLALAHSPRANDDHVYGGIHFDAAADIVIQLLSEVSPDGTLGIGLNVVKTNDTSTPPMQILAYEFGENGLKHIRKAKPLEFPEITSKPKTTMLQEVMGYLDEHEQASATEISEELNRSRPKISEMLKHNSNFTPIKKDGKSVIYGLKYRF
ncbi:hypothetical protein LCGC14_0369900 [marine sediment metagenome]|uniref:AAA+ ATPase domain-containing protein n=1 Tax=marine sediment metagenome TaxID=412755 RepID=A0A0F9VSP1_9ZZZZ